MISLPTCGQSTRRQLRFFSSMVKKSRPSRSPRPLRRNTPRLKSSCLISDRVMRSSRNVRLTILLLILASGICVAPCVSVQAREQEDSRLRARALGIVVGSYPTGPLNAMTDVAGVTVGQTTLISGDGPLKPGIGPIRTGVTVVIPRDD